MAEGKTWLYTPEASSAEKERVGAPRALFAPSKRRGSETNRSGGSFSESLSDTSRIHPQLFLTSSLLPLTHHPIQHLEGRATNRYHGSAYHCCCWTLREKNLRPNDEAVVRVLPQFPVKDIQRRRCRRGPRRTSKLSQLRSRTRLFIHRTVPSETEQTTVLRNVPDTLLIHAPCHQRRTMQAMIAACYSRTGDME